jgi:gag-polypeptide of LTR copia-type
LKLELQASKKGDSTCVQYLQQMQSFANHFRSIRSEISNPDFVLYTFQGLGTDYESFVTVVSLRSDTLTMAEFQCLLLSHETRVKVNLASVSSPSVHLTTSSDVSLSNSVFVLFTGTSHSKMVGLLPNAIIALILPFLALILLQRLNHIKLSWLSQHDHLLQPDFLTQGLPSM